MEIQISSLSNDLHKATKEKVQKLDSIRGKESLFPFWDIIVLSALDEEQQRLYETQIKEKLSRKELPISPTYHVLHDPVGVKVGNGGGVISVLDDLSKIYQDNLKKKKVLILLSGGYSQRLPSASLLGKVFTALPLGNPIFQMIEFKLAMYIDFPQRMKSGVFVSSSDCIELYELTGEEWTFMNPGVTALAHPSPIDIGTTHGVYVLDEPVENIVKEASVKSRGTTCSAFMGKCLKMIHKPSKELMRSCGAVFLKEEEEYIYSDSAYFMDIETGLLLLDWYRKRNGIQCEIDAYGDFLQALGPQATKEYCQNVKNVTMVDEELIPTREEIFDVLRQTQLNVLMLNKSKFYHLGTTKEYLEHFCQDHLFRNEMSCSNQAMVKSSQFLKDLDNSIVLIHSLIKNTDGISRNVVIEYTELSEGCSIGSNSIISNNVFPVGVSVPEKSFIHTVVIRDEGMAKYVTIAFGTDDNLKKSCQSRSDTVSLKYASLSFDKALEKLKLSKDPWPEESPLLNLWHARIFPSFSSPEQALRHGAAMLSSCRIDTKFEMESSEERLYSMADILKLKDVEGFLNMRSQLRQKIVD
ncbi:fucose-1-phosphate guanylyltransferase-like [Clytia hemisphaerica]|uniref:GDP-fucose pyrophosphorylase domain-containing protein n=1 Tax=Clytia hemisphaerica TaxID=252671 RepID=A0A7M5TUL0_9CNID|eukprot:TCONS_00007604-protein